MTRVFSGDIWDRVREIISTMTGLEEYLLDESHWLGDVAQPDTKCKEIVAFLEEDFHVDLSNVTRKGCSLGAIVNAIAEQRNA